VLVLQLFGCVATAAGSGVSTLCTAHSGSRYAGSGCSSVVPMPLAPRLQYPVRGADRRPTMLKEQARSIVASLASVLATVISVLLVLAAAA
jgi:hypothetical protein